MNHTDLINEVNAKLEALLDEVERAYRTADDTLEPIEDLEFMLSKPIMAKIFDRLDMAVSELAWAKGEIKEVLKDIENDIIPLSDEYMEQQMNKEIFREYKRG